LSSLPLFCLIPFFWGPVLSSDFPFSVHSIEKFPTFYSDLFPSLFSSFSSGIPLRPNFYVEPASGFSSPPLWSMFVFPRSCLASFFLPFLRSSLFFLIPCVFPPQSFQNFFFFPPLLWDTFGPPLTPGLPPWALMRVGFVPSFFRADPAFLKESFSFTAKAPYCLQEFPSPFTPLWPCIPLNSPSGFSDPSPHRRF